MIFANFFKTTHKTAPRRKATTAPKARLVGLVALAFATTPALAAPVAEEGGAGGLRGPAARDDEGASPAPRDVVPPEGDGAPLPPRDAQRRDLPPPDDEAAPVGGRAGPLVARRLRAAEEGGGLRGPVLLDDEGAPPAPRGLDLEPQDRRLAGEDQGDGWTKYAGKYLSGKNKLWLKRDDVNDEHLTEDLMPTTCKRVCEAISWCRNFDWATTENKVYTKSKCVLSDNEVVYEAGLQNSLTNDWDHYALNREDLPDVRVELLEQLEQPGGWTIYEGKKLSDHNKLWLKRDDEHDEDLAEDEMLTTCKQACQVISWCKNFDWATNENTGYPKSKCVLSDQQVDEDGLQTSDDKWDHYSINQPEPVPVPAPINQPEPVPVPAPAAIYQFPVPNSAILHQGEMRLYAAECYIGCRDQNIPPHTCYQFCC